MAQLKVRKLYDRLVQSFKERAASRGHSTEGQQIRQADVQSRGLAHHLTSIPDVGDDEDFERDHGHHRPVDL